MAAEGVDDILFVGRGETGSNVHEHVGAERHVERIGIFVHLAVRRVSHDSEVDVQRFSELVLVGEVECFGIFARSEFACEAQLNGFLLERGHGAAGGAYAEPFGHIVDRILMYASADVADVEGVGVEVVLLLVVDGVIDVAVLPLECVAIDKREPCDRRLHGVAVQVFYIAHGDIGGLLVDLVILHADVDEQLVGVERPAEVELVEQSVVAYGGEFGLVGFVSQVWLILHERYDLVNDLTVGVLEGALVIGAEHEFEHSVGVEHLLGEGQVRHQPHLIAGGCHVVALLNQCARQCLLVDGELVDVTRESLAAEVHSAAQTSDFGSRHVHQELAVEEEGGGVVTAVNGECEMVPLVVGCLRQERDGIAVAAQGEQPVLQSEP